MASREDIFRPASFPPVKSIEGYSIISGNYFKVANDLRAMAEKGFGGQSGRHYVFPCVVMYVAAFEAFLQEHLAFSRFRVATSANQEGATEMLEKLDSLKNQSAPYNCFKTWIKEIYRIYDQRDEGIDTNSPEYQNILALKELRNSVVHYNPMFIEVASWPARLEQVLHRTKIDVLNAGWVTNFSNLTVANWAHDSTKAAVQLFSRISDAQDPFTVVLERDGMYPWE